MNRRPLFRLVALVALAALAGCEANQPGTILTPSGRRPVPANSSITGRIDFGDGTFPRTLVLVAPVLEPGCISAYTKIGVSGTLVAAGFTPTAAPQLTQLAPCYWIDTLTILPASPAEWKFTTNDNFDEAPDYGAPGAQLDGLEGLATSPAPGPDGNLTANVSASQAGLVLCTLDETLAPQADYAFRKIVTGSPAAFTSTADGSFSITGLEPGAYNVLVRTPGNLRDTLITNVQVSGPTSLGVLNLGGAAPTGGVTGQVAYDHPTNGFPDITSPPWPPTTVQLLQGLTLVQSVEIGGATNAFAFTDVPPGTYDVVADANVFTRITVSGVTVAAGTPTDVGTISLPKNNAEVSNIINVAGDFNGFNKDSLEWEMGQTSLGVWSVTSPHPINAGVNYMKFVTDQNFDVPPDWGGDETVTITVPVTSAATRKVTGSGTAIKLDFTTGGNYTFTLDERRQVFTIQPAPAPGRIAITRSRRR